MVGDDGEDLERSTREFADLMLVAAKRKGQIGGGTKGPVPFERHEIDAPARVKGLKGAEDRLDIRAARQTFGEVVCRNRGGRGEKASAQRPAPAMPATISTSMTALASQSRADARRRASATQ